MCSARGSGEGGRYHGAARSVCGAYAAAAGAAAVIMRSGAGTTGGPHGGAWHSAHNFSALPFLETRGLMLLVGLVDMKLGYRL